jgi:hypothetical protein
MLLTIKTFAPCANFQEAMVVAETNPGAPLSRQQGERRSSLRWVAGRSPRWAIGRICAEGSAIAAGLAGWNGGAEVDCLFL